MPPTAEQTSSITTTTPAASGPGDKRYMPWVRGRDSGGSEADRFSGGQSYAALALQVAIRLYSEWHRDGELAQQQD